MRYEDLILTSRSLYDRLSSLIVEDLVELVHVRRQGHRLLVTDQPIEVLEGICKDLRAKVPACEAFLLSNQPDQDWMVSSTKLIEKRNTSKQMIVIFVPPTLRTSAEDSFALDNFERYPSERVFPRLLGSLREAVPPEFSETVDRVLSEVRPSGISQVRYLLALEKVTCSQEAIGLALFHIGLIPDRSLPSELVELSARLIRNKAAVELLSNPRLPTLDAVSRLDLDDPAQGDRIASFMRTVGSRDPSEWLPRILDGSYVSDLSFDHWTPKKVFTGGIKDIEITAISTTGMTEDGKPKLDLFDQDELKVTWVTNPTPTRCEGLDRFSLELVKDDNAVSGAKVIKKGIGRSEARSGKLQNIRALGLSDGLYNVRVRAWGEGNSLLHEVLGSTPFWMRTAPGQTDPDDTTEVKEKVNKADSLAEAYVLSQKRLATSGRSVLQEDPPELIREKGEEGGSDRFTDALKVKFSPSNMYDVQMNSILARWEEETLADTKGLGRYDVLTDDMAPTLRSIDLGQASELVDEFLDARKEAFDAIRGSSAVGMVETNFLSDLSKAAQAYLDSYLALLEWASQEDVRARTISRWLLNIDSVRLRLDGNDYAYLVGPTHPLKFAWSVLFSDFVKRTCSGLTASSDPSGRLVASISRLTSLNLPYSIMTDDGEPLIDVDDFGPYWGIYIPACCKDIRSEVAKVRSKLGSSSMDDRFTTVSSRNVFIRVARYLDQHPYVNTLVMNIVQPGTASMLVDLLLDLQGHYPDVSYRMNLFSQEDSLESMGSAFDSFMTFDRTEKGTAEKDELLASSANSLFPKFMYSKHHSKELIDRPEEFEAHISILFDVFQAEVRFEERIPDLRSSYLGGLLHEFVDSYLNKDGKTYWRRQVLPGLSVPDGLAGTMVAAYRSHDHLLAVSDGPSGVSGVELVPTVLLDLGPTDKNLISLVHEISDWVFTIDRNFGLEYLDDPYDLDDPVYVIDQEPDQFSHFGHRFFISTGHLGEADRIVRPVLKELGLPDSVPVAESVIYALRSSSSRLLLKLLSSTQASRGAIGMAFARIYMERSSDLKDMLLIPLDSHMDILSTGRQDADARGNGLSGQRSDLLLVELGARPGLLRFHLVEVKFRSSMGDAAFEDLKLHVNSQLETSLQELRHLFDAGLEDPDRVDRPFLTHELIGLLKDYLERAIRYQLVPAEFEKGFYTLIDSLENGYTLEMTKNAIIFSMDSTGLQTFEENGIDFHVIGKDRLVLDLDAAVQARDKNEPVPEEPTYLRTRKTFTDRGIGVGLDAKPDPVVRNEPSKEVPTPKEKEEEKDKVIPPLVDAEKKPALDARVIIGANSASPQMGILGKVWNDKFAMDLNTPNTISVFGVQGSGKSYTLGSIIEMSLMSIPNLNVLKKPFGVVVFHYSDTEEYAPEILSIIEPNTGAEAEKLKQVYGVDPSSFKDVVMLVPEVKLEQRKKEYPSIDVRPVLFDPSELDSDAWHYLMGATGNDAMYVRTINKIIKDLDRMHMLTFDGIWSSIVEGDLDKAQQRRAGDRLEFAKEYIKDGMDLGSAIAPGRLVVVDLREKYIKKADAIGLFMILQKVLAEPQYEGERFNRLFVFDEAHNYMGTDFADEILGAIRLMRHHGNSVVIASQDPVSVPAKVIELSSIVVLHKMTAPNWLKHIKGSVAALGDLSPGDLNMLHAGQAYIWAKESNRTDFQDKAIKVEMRPRVTKHGGETLKAVS